MSGTPRQNSIKTTEKKRISGMVDETTTAAKEISVATQQQRSASDQVVAAMTQVSDVSRQYAVGSKQAAAAAACRSHPAPPGQLSDPYAEAPCVAEACATGCLPSANSSTIFEQNAGRSSVP